MRSLTAATMCCCLISRRGGSGQHRTPRGRPLRLTAEVLGQQHCAAARRTDACESNCAPVANVGGPEVNPLPGRSFLPDEREPQRIGRGAPPPRGIYDDRWDSDELAEKIEHLRPEGLSYPAAGRGLREQQDCRRPGRASGRGVPVTNASCRDHVLQVTVLHWYESRALAQKLRESWQRSGLLWFEPVTSAPVPFNVAEERPASGCR